MKRVVLSAILALLASPALAQWQVPNSAVPVGRGPGVVGFSSVAPGSNGQCLTVVAGVWASAACGSGTGITTPCAIGTVVVGGGVGVIPNCADIATQNQFYAGTADKFIQAGVLWPAETTTTYGTTTTFDFATFKNTKVTLTGNITTQTFSNVIAGKAGMITFIQDGTGSRTTVWNSILKFSGGTTPTLTTTAGAVDILTYACRTATFCGASLLTDVR